MNVNILNRITGEIGVVIPKTSAILDFGCGAGGTVYKLVDQGYSDVFGYDVQDYLNLRHQGDRSRFSIGTPLQQRLPWDDETFDLVLSDQVFEHVKDQVAMFRELHRITKRGGIHLHVIPARYHLIEGHIHVPFASVFAHRWWFKLWALLGVRNKYQEGMSADATADMNAFFFVEKINYLPTSHYRVMWKELGFEYRFIHQAYFDTHNRGLMRLFGKISRVVPMIGWLYPMTRARIVYLKRA